MYIYIYVYIYISDPRPCEDSIVEATEPHLLIASDEAHEAHEDRFHSDLHMGCRKLWDMVLIIYIYIYIPSGYLT